MTNIPSTSTQRRSQCKSLTVRCQVSQIRWKRESCLELLCVFILSNAKYWRIVSIGQLDEIRQKTCPQRKQFYARCSIHQSFELLFTLSTYVRYKVRTIHIFHLIVLLKLSVGNLLRVRSCWTKWIFFMLILFTIFINWCDLQIIIWMYLGWMIWYSFERYLCEMLWN